MSKRIKRNRPRLEFAELEAMLEPGFQENASRQFVDSILHDTPPTKSFAKQFKLLDRVRRAHARRDRYNSNRQQRKLRALQREFDPKIAGYLALEHATALNLFGEGIGSPEQESFTALRGVVGTDLRFTKRFLRECEVIKQLVSLPTRPWLVDRINIGEDNEVNIPPRDAAFESSLVSTPIPEVPETAVFDQTGECSSAIDESGVHKAS